MSTQVFRSIRFSGNRRENGAKGQRPCTDRQQHVVPDCRAYCTRACPIRCMYVDAVDSHDISSGVPNVQMHQQLHGCGPRCNS
jgi:hypothetical protein